MVNVIELKKKVSIFENLLEEYNNNFLNLYKIIDNLSLYWNDSVSRQFYLDTSEEKKHVIINNIELKNLNDVYCYICDNYFEFADKVDFDLKKFDKVLVLFDKFINILEEIINLYDSLDYNFCAVNFVSLNFHKETLKQLKKQFLELKLKNKEMLLNLTDLEKDVYLRLSKINIEKMSDESLKKYMPDVSDCKFSMNLTEVSIALRKLVVYKINLDTIFENIKEIISDINCDYVTDNLDILREIELLFGKKLSIISSVFDHYLTVINENIEKYVLADTRAKNILSEGRHFYE